MPKSAGYVSPQYLKMIANIVRSFKISTYEMMCIQKGDTVLDIGCGPGVDTVELSSYVGPNGKVYGIDIDEEMIECANNEAVEKKVSNNVIHQIGSLDNMPFEDNSINACRAERLFQVIPSDIDRQPLFNEIYRVLKPSGKVVLVDTDWATSSVDYSDENIERKLLAFLATQMRPDGFAGRSFKRYLLQGRFTDVEIRSISLVQTKYEETAFGEWLISAAVEKDVITKDEADLWNNELKKKSDDGIFYASVGSVIAVATKK